MISRSTGCAWASRYVIQCRKSFATGWTFGAGRRYRHARGHRARHAPRASRTRLSTQRLLPALRAARISGSAGVDCGGPGCTSDRGFTRALPGLRRSGRALDYLGLVAPGRRSLKSVIRRMPRPGGSNPFSGVVRTTRTAASAGARCSVGALGGRSAGRAGGRTCGAQHSRPAVSAAGRETCQSSPDSWNE